MWNTFLMPDDDLLNVMYFGKVCRKYRFHIKCFKLYKIIKIQ